MASRRRLKRAAGAAAANAVTAKNPATLLGLPEIVICNVIEQIVLEGVGTKASTSRRRVFSARQIEPDISFKDAYKNLSPLTGTSKSLRALTYAYLGKEITLTEENSNTLLFQHKTRYWSKQLLCKVEKIRIRMSFGMKLKPEDMWPQYIKFFQNLTPSIIHLELYSTFHVNDDNYPRKLSGEPLHSVSRLDQERRFKLFFLSYLTPRHQTLNRIILPGDSIQVVDDTIYHYLIAEKPFIDKPQDCSFVWNSTSSSVGEDEILNATLIRRHKWTELCTTADTKFIVHPLEGQTKDNILCSEVNYDDQKYWNLLTYRAYSSQGMAEANKWRSLSADELVDSCKSFEWREKWAAAAFAAAWKAGSKELRKRLGTATPQQRAKKAFRCRVSGYSDVNGSHNEYSNLCLNMASWTYHRLIEVESEIAADSAALAREAIAAASVY